MEEQTPAPIFTGKRWKKRRPSAFLVHEFFKVDALFRPSKIRSERRDEAIPLIRRANPQEPAFCRDIDNDFFALPHEPENNQTHFSKPSVKISERACVPSRSG